MSVVRLHNENDKGFALFTAAVIFLLPLSTITICMSVLNSKTEKAYDDLE